VFLTDEYKIGIDIKFQQDGKVFIFVPKDKQNYPNREQLLQMVGRG